jgi:cellulose synthase/poly-beta-1,6-N-acetylglucosamine synthase-like glycosyltransferase
MHELASVVESTILFVAAVPATLACLYLLMLTCLSGAVRVRRTTSRDVFFDVFVPAYNEAAGIARTVANLLRLDWPAERFRVIVIADNCTDDTAGIARGAGALVIERQDAVSRGKGYALAHAFGLSRAEGRADAVVVVDADSEASANLLQSFAARIGAGESAMQAHYGVLNASASWRTRLMAIALGAIHKVRSRARERLRLSCGIRGNGWCVTHALLDQVPYKAFSLTEDVEFGNELGLAGYRVAYCDESHVNGEMVTSEEAARSQRMRWEGGRLALVVSQVPKLLRAAVVKCSTVRLDLALDLLVPPLSYIVLNVVAVIVLALLFRQSDQAVYLWVGAADALAVVSYVCRGWVLSGVGAIGFWDLLRVPWFIGWKVLLLAARKRPSSWVRTKRENT